MKKISIYILILVAIISISIETASAKEIIKENDQQILIAADSAVKPTLIPRPDTLPGPTPTEQAKEGGTRNIFINRILPYLAVGMIGMGGGISLLFIIIGGVRFATSYGNEESIKKAKEQVIYAIVGFLVAMLSYTIVTAVTRIDLVGNTTKQEDEYVAPEPEPLYESPQEYEASGRAGMVQQM